MIRLKEEKLKSSREQDVTYRKLKTENEMLKNDLSSKFHETIDLKRQLAALKVNIRFEAQIIEQNKAIREELKATTDEIE